jgi:hypothetical protein
MILDVHREVALSGLARDSLRDGPARERAAALESEVVVKAAGVVALHDEDRGLARARGRAERLRRAAAGTLALVLAKTCHAVKDASRADFVSVGVYAGEARV